MPLRTALNRSATRPSDPALIAEKKGMSRGIARIAALVGPQLEEEALAVGEVRAG